MGPTEKPQDDGAGWVRFTPGNSTAALSDARLRAPPAAVLRAVIDLAWTSGSHHP